MYLLCVGQKWVTPGEFWAMPPGELWWLVDAMTPDTSLPQSELSDLYDLMRAEQASEVEQADG
ncbi:MAG: hypothetical protein EBT13_18375 [Rhodobacteraceae bacterium]|nr:hypothetical protein [Paracoccaceae bacterium]